MVLFAFISVAILELVVMIRFMKLLDYVILVSKIFTPEPVTTSKLTLPWTCHNFTRTLPLNLTRLTRTLPQGKRRLRVSVTTAQDEDDDLVLTRHASQVSSFKRFLHTKTRFNPDLSQLNPDLTQLNTDLSQLHPDLAQLNPDLAQLNPDLAQVTSDDRASGSFTPGINSV